MQYDVLFVYENEDRDVNLAEKMRYVMHWVLRVHQHRLLRHLRRRRLHRRLRRRRRHHG